MTYVPLLFFNLTRRETCYVLITTVVSVGPHLPSNMKRPRGLVLWDAFILRLAIFNHLLGDILSSIGRAISSNVFGAKIRCPIALR